MRPFRKWLLVVFLGVAATWFLFKSYTGQEVDFNAEVRPILNTKCISCHGGVKESGGFSLFSREHALRPTKAGRPAIVPGDPAGSEFIKRLTHHDPEERMPYHGEPLPEAEIETLRKWIKQGAHWQDHWAYLPPAKSAPPETDTAWGHNAVDAFVLARMKQEGLGPSAPADRPTLLRRLSLDLTGLPPTEQQVLAFEKDASPNAYEKQVDRLLASPQYGERWAAMWLDLARYADSRGYEKDEPRNIWRFRDYVIRSFNADKPFDQFTTEQLAGDLLPRPTEAQLIATAYHRNTANNDEGGTDDEEFRTAAVLDRVSNTWEVWQGTTMACVQCHSHPYDPVRHEEFYSSMAFFNNTRDEDIPDESSALKHFDTATEGRIKELAAWMSSQVPADKAPKVAAAMQHLVRFTEPKIHAHSFDSLTNASMYDGKWLVAGHKGFGRLKNVELTGKSHLLVSYGGEKPGGLLEIRLDRLDGPVIGRMDIEKVANFYDYNGYRRKIIDLQPTSGRHTLFFVFSNPSFKNPEDYVGDIDWIVFLDPLPGAGQPGYDTARETLVSLLNGRVEKTPVLLENPEGYRRKTHLFIRGNWLTKGAEVQPGTPGFLPAFRQYPKNRLGLAQWFISQQNPLTARVTVNRFWEQLFGAGLVETLEDFGSQGMKPTHPELLDYLAVTFRDEDKWRVKPLLKRLVMSATYRQSSKVSKLHLARDPANRYLARGPRVRLTAEQVRDQALATGGLLSLKMYGKPVMPPQPNGVWQVVYSGETWKTSAAEDAWRRALYTFWRRSSPYPSLMTFDAAGREVCVSRRIRTNTPLQALVTLNDTVYITAARSLAARMQQAGGSLENQLARGYRLAVFKAPSPQQIRVLGDLYRNADRHYRDNPAEAAKLLGEDPEAPAALVLPVAFKQGNPARHRASLTVVANAIMNLDEFVMKE